MGFYSLPYPDSGVGGGRLYKGFMPVLFWFLPQVAHRFARTGSFTESNSCHCLLIFCYFHLSILKALQVAPIVYTI